MSRPRAILDCDPGHDDALAIALAARHTELLGITTVAGNVGLAATSRNARVMTRVLNLNVPVHAGAAQPLVAPPRSAEFIHGASGLDGPEHPSDLSPLASEDAIGFILESAARHPGLWLIATGPLTNVALALKRDPSLAKRLAGISIMGGGVPFGNATPAAEFNILVDPEAADVVFRSGARLLMAGLNVTHQWRIGSAQIARLEGLPGGAARFAAELLRFYAGRYAAAFSGVAEGPLHDPVAVLAITHPQLLESERLNVVVELTGTHTRGMTLADLRRVKGGAPANVEVLMRIDAEAANDLLVETLASFG
jgi:inosine-uridine nucleoside N-ribohydrolase